MGMRFTNDRDGVPEGRPERFATVVGGRPGGRGGWNVELSPEIAAFLTRLFEEPAFRRAFAADRAALVAADPALADADRALLLAIAPEKIAVLEAMIPAPPATRKSALMAAAVTAVAIFLGLATPVAAAAPTTAPDGSAEFQAPPYPMPPGGCRPMEAEDMAVSRGIRPDIDADELIRPQIVKGIRPDLDLSPDGVVTPQGLEDRFGTTPVQLRPVETTVVTDGTAEVTSGGTTEVQAAPKPPVVRPNLTRGIRPSHKID